jgi:PKD repeat protein
MTKPLLLTLSVLFVLFSSPAFAQTPEFSSDIVEGCAPLVVKFKDETTGGTPLSWEWDMGNGTVIYNIRNPSATFINPGTYTVKLIINKGNGEKAVAKSIKVYAPPVVAFTSTNANGCFPLPVKFTDQSTPGSGTIDKWEWDFGDGSAFSNSKNAEHVYGAVGSYHVTLRVTNSNGCMKTINKQHYVSISTGAKAEFDFSAPNSCNPPTPITFTDKSETSGPLTYEWNFGNGGTFVHQNRKLFRFSYHYQ